MTGPSPVDNVVYLARTERGQGRAIPRRVEELRRHVEGRLVQLLRDGLERAHDALAQVAAQDGETASDCRLGMQMVRLHRHDMEQVLRAGVEYRFSALVDPSTIDPPRIPADDPAATRLLQGLKDTAGAEVRRTTWALDAAVPTVRVSDRVNPLAPEQVADVVLRAEQRLPLSAPAHRLLLEILGDDLATALPRLYRETIDALQAANQPTPEAQPHTSVASETHFAERAARSRERVEAARERVEAEIARCLEGRQPPALIDRLIRESWARLLLLVHINEGPDSESWVRHCAVMERLLWSLEAHPDENARRQLVLEIPLLLHEISDGLRQVLHDPFELSKLLQALEAEYLRCLTRDDPQLMPASANDDEAAVRGREGDERRIASLPVGTWMEIEGRDGSRLRVRLAARTPEGRLIFANRAGFKVLERDIEELAAVMAEGRAQLLDDHQLFNHGLSLVVRRLAERRAGHGE